MRGVGGLAKGVTWASSMMMSNGCRMLSSPSQHRRQSWDNKRSLHTSPISREILKSTYPDITPPEMSLTEFVFKDFDKFGNRAALIDGLTGRQVTFPEVRDQVGRVASGLTRAGFKKGDVMLIASHNSIEYIILFHAVVTCGGVLTMVNPLYPAADILRQTKDSNATFFVCTKDQLPKIEEVSKTVTGTVKKIWVTDDSSQSPSSFSTLLADDGSAHPGSVAINPREDVCLLPYSSGTTGMPKGVMLTHYAEVANIIQSDTPTFFPEREGAVQLGNLPFYHMFATFAYFNLGLAWGQTTIVLQGFNPEQYLTSIAKYKVSLLFTVPPIILFLTKHPIVAKFDLTSIRRVISAAAPLGRHTEEDFLRKNPGCTIGQGYGMTETAPVVAISPVEHSGKYFGTAGSPVASTEIKYVDPETGKDCTAGETGELWVRGPQTMKGYLNNPEATASTIDKEGWLHTGDIGHFEGDRLYIVDRIKELIKYKGLQVPPAELEALLCTHPAVADAGVIGVPDEEAGELPRAFVQLKPNSNANEKELVDFVADKVVAYKKLRGGLEFIEVLPRTPSGKILRRELKGLLKH